MGRGVLAGERRSLTHVGAVWRVVAAGICLAAAACGVSAYIRYRQTVYWNFSSHVYYYLHPVLYGTAGVVAIVGLVQGIRSVRSPGTASGRWLTVVLLVLFAMTVWAGLSTLMARAYLV